VLQAKDLSIRYPDGREGLRSVSCEIREGECVLLAGPTGSGKSTLAHALLNIIPHRVRARRTGEVSFKGDPIDLLEVNEVSSRIQLALQNPDATLFGVTLRENICFGPENLKLPKEEILRRLDTLADSFGLRSLLDRSPFEFSSGEKQRACLASLLAMESGVLILDEPFTYLDEAGRRELAEYLGRLKAAGKTVLLIEHSFQEVRELIDRIFVMDAGTLREEADRKIFFDTDNLLRQTADLRAEREEGSTVEPFVRISNVSFEYEKGKPVFTDLSFETGGLPDVLPLMGPNGSGKTTLGLILAGLLKPQRGTFDLGRVSVGFVFQSPEMQLFCRSVRDELAFGLRNKGVKNEEADRRVDEMLLRLDLTEKKDSHPQNLSRGEKRRLALGAALILRPGLLVLDEPTVGQDAASLCFLQALIEGEAADGIRFLILTQDKDFAARLSSRYLYLSGSRLELKEFQRELV